MSAAIAAPTDPSSPDIPAISTLPIARILIPENRQRLEVREEALGELSASIQAIGLLHPVVVRRDGDKFYLVAGERRLRAVRLMAIAGRGITVGGYSIPLGEVPVTDFGELAPEAAHEAELEENIRRVDLTMSERVLAIAALHKLRQLRNPEHTVKDTAKEAYPDLARGFTKTRDSLVIARSMETMPELRKVKTEQEAMKLINRASQYRINERLAEAVGRLSTSDLHEVHHADANDWLAFADEGRFRCILIDPPYGMDAESFGDGAGRLQGITHKYRDTPESFQQLMEGLAAPLTRVAAAESHLYIWCDIDGFHFLRALFREHGWWVFRTPLINFKREGGRVPWPEHGPRRCYELVLYAVRGKLPTTALYRDIFESTLEGDNLGHGAQKPVEAYTELLKRSTVPGDAVLDCFAGTGTILVAAHQLKLRAVAVEKEAGAFGICVERLRGLK